jgi:hypothetical protein
MKIDLQESENIRTFDLKVGEKDLDGEITNRSNDGVFVYKTDDFPQTMNSDELRAIAETLDDLNK